LLSDISLRLSAGDRLAIVGPSGAGKSLLLRALALLDRFEGDLFYRGTAVQASDVPLYRSRVVLLPQQSNLLVGKVRAALMEPCGFHVNRARRWDQAYLHALLTELGRSDDFLDQQTRELSGGERQLVVLLRAMLLRPNVLLLDEPTSAIDRETSRQVETVLMKWVDESDRAYAWVTHHQAQAERISTRTITMRQGQIVSDSRE
jgi:putative ABC transport system ATP-binding protein